MNIDFKGSQYPKDVILHGVFSYVRYAVSYRDFEAILAERGVQIDHATLNRWVVKYRPISLKPRKRKNRRQPSSGGWTKPTLRFGANGRICTARLIVMANP